MKKVRVKKWNRLTTKEKVTRWENVLRVLRSLTPHERRKHWDMANWGIKTDCGTIACAAGHCALDPWFKRRGLYLKFKRSLYLADEGAEYAQIYPDPTVFFGSEGTENIFYDSRNRPVGQVIREVKAHIKNLKEITS